MAITLALQPPECGVLIVRKITITRLRAQVKSIAEAKQNAEAEPKKRKMVEFKVLASIMELPTA